MLRIWGMGNAAAITNSDIQRIAIFSKYCWLVASAMFCKTISWINSDSN